MAFSEISTLVASFAPALPSVFTGAWQRNNDSVTVLNMFASVTNRNDNMLIPPCRVVELLVRVASGTLLPRGAESSRAEGMAVPEACWPQGWGAESPAWAVVEAVVLLLLLLGHSNPELPVVAVLVHSSPDMLGGLELLELHHAATRHLTIVQGQEGCHPPVRSQTTGLHSDYGSPRSQKDLAPRREGDMAPWEWPALGECTFGLPSEHEGNPAGGRL